MKQLFIAGCGALLLASLAGGAAHAGVYDGWLQPGPPPVERFVKPLGLSAAQQAKLKPIFVAAQAKAAREEAIKAKARTTSDDAVSNELVTRDADFRVQLATVLTPEQMSEYERLTADHASSSRALDTHAAHTHHDMNPPAPEPGQTKPPAPPAK